MSHLEAGLRRGGSLISLVPSLTTPQRDALSSPSFGDVIYNSTTDQIEVRRNNSGSPAWTESSPPAGWTDAGAVVHLATVADNAAMGATTAAAGRKLRILETGADAGLRCEAAASGTNAFDAIVTGDTNPRVQITGGTINFGPGNAVTDTNLFRDAGGNMLRSDDALRIDGEFNMSGTQVFQGATRRVNISLIPTVDASFSLGDTATPRTWANLGLSGQLLFGAPAVPGDAGLERGAANRLDVITGDSLNVVAGNFQMGAVTVFEADRDVAIPLLPNADTGFSLGSAARRWNQVFGANVLASVDVTTPYLIHQAANLTVIDTVLVDTDLVLSLPQTGIYVVQVFARFDNGALGTDGFRHAFEAELGLVVADILRFSTHYNASADALGAIGTSTNITGAFTQVGAAADIFNAFVDMKINVTTIGSLRFQVAKNTDVSNDTVFGANSWMIAWRRN